MRSNRIEALGHLLTCLGREWPTPRPTIRIIEKDIEETLV